MRLAYSAKLSSKRNAGAPTDSIVVEVWQ